jgi:hypothetical protein
MRKRLADPAACGIRLGVELRAAAEREAYLSGMCLSHWIKALVQEAVRHSGGNSETKPHDSNKTLPAFAPNSDVSGLKSAFRKEMEKMHER